MYLRVFQLNMIMGSPINIAEKTFENGTHLSRMTHLRRYQEKALGSHIIIIIKYINNIINTYLFIYACNGRWTSLDAHPSRFIKK